METRLYQVDAFTSEPFAGNPAAVCPMDAPADEAWMAQVAAEMNLSETAFVHPEGGGFRLRWFTPTGEVRLCGHATLATAHVLWETGAVSGDEIRFHTRSGSLGARRTGGGIELDLPALPPEPCAPPEAGDPDYLIEVEIEREVRDARPDFRLLGEAVPEGVILTARSGSPAWDFVSRYFAPRWGIDEDPVTGAAHCVLGPHWSRKLEREKLVGYQASARGGTVRVRMRGDRALLSGGAVTVLRGTLAV